MPGTTPNRSYPFPQAADPLNVAGDIEALARAVDADAGPRLLRKTIYQLNSQVVTAATVAKLIFPTETSDDIGITQAAGIFSIPAGLYVFGLKITINIVGTTSGTLNFGTNAGVIKSNIFGGAVAQDAQTVAAYAVGVGTYWASHQAYLPSTTFWVDSLNAGTSDDTYTAGVLEIVKLA